MSAPDALTVYTPFDKLVEPVAPTAPTSTELEGAAPNAKTGRRQRQNVHVKKGFITLS
jgi:hypothetical protein